MAQEQTVVQVTAFGPEYEKGIRVVKGPVPEPGQGQALVRMLLRPVNPADVFSALGVYAGFQPSSLPAVLGLEGIGRIEKLGAGASGRLAAGQRVVATTWPTAVGNGTWQQFVAVAEEDLVAVPEGVSDEAAAQALVNPVTVLAMFKDLATPKGDWVIVTAGGSALGRMAISYAKSLGLHTIVTVRRAEQKQELKDAGADEVVVVPGESLAERAKAVTGGRGAWGAIDALAGDMPLQCAEAVRVHGDVINYGAMNGPDVKWSFAQSVFRHVALRGMWLSLWLAQHTPEQRREVIVEVLRLFETGVFPSDIGEVLPLEDVIKGLQLQAVVGRKGKVLLRG